MRTPEQITSFLDTHMYRMDVPAMFYGDEPNSYKKDWANTALHVNIFACWSYEQAAGNQAIPLVYRTINEWNAKYLCDRWYFPATPRDLRMFESNGIPVFGLESRHELLDFDVVGTSVSYPVLTINFTKQLLMSGIPPTREDRYSPSQKKTMPGREREPERWPFVLVGGQGYGGPEVLAAIADCVFVGEVEDEPGNPGLGAVLDRIAAYKRSGQWKKDRVACYEGLAREFDFLYFPRFVDVHYEYENRPTVDEVPILEDDAQPSKQVVGYTSKLTGMRLPIRKRFVRDLDAVKALDNPPLLYMDPGMGAADLEAARGCPAWCSFCALSWRQKPYRQRSVERTVEDAAALTRNTGSLHIAPFGPDFPMHTQKKRLIRDLLEQVTDEVDASTMRVDDFIADPSYILLSGMGGMDSVTLGVEGNSQRMRDLVGKGVADEDVKEAVARGIAAGVRKFKLYMIASLPGEDEGDIYRILELARQIADIRESLGSTARIQWSWTPMLIESNTPFQWFAPTYSNFALGDVWEEFRDLKMDFKMGGKAARDKWYYFQLSQRASREIGMAMIEAVADSGAGSWGAAPHGTADAVERRLVERGFHNGFSDAFDERFKADMFGWEMIDQGINVELMWVTYQQMVEFLEHTNSETYDSHFGDDYQGNEWIERCDTRCYGKTCGVCSPDDLKLRREYIRGADEEIDVDLAAVKIVDQRSLEMKVRAKVRKAVSHRFVQNDHNRYAVRRAAFLSDVPITKRSIRFASDAIKFKNYLCGVDFVEFGLTRRASKESVAEMIAEMNKRLGHMQIEDWVMLGAQSAQLRSDVDVSLFEMEIEVGREQAASAVSRWLQAEYVPMVFREESRNGGMIREEVNGKDWVGDLWLVQDGHRLLLRMLIRGKANPYVVYAALFNERSWIEASRFPAYRIEAFIEAGESYDFFRASCERCDEMIPSNVLDQAYDERYCPKCKDLESGMVVGALVS